MDVAALLTDAIDRIRSSLRDAVEGLEAEALAFRPDDEANPIGWLAWHTARIQDDHVAALASHEQLYVTHGWAERLGMPADESDIGYGHDRDDVAAHVPQDATTLLAYLDAVCDRTKAFLDTLTPDDLDRVVDESWDPPVTAGVRLVSVVNDNLQHTGQAAYVRGLWERRG
ncbi:DinB family protein [Euzebya sp.]|uniref:mycothiol transferase n=1 Tax=Euzebya sp. TaxID=1971409 RepID=UPI003516594A